MIRGRQEEEIEENKKRREIKEEKQKWTMKE